MDIVTPEKRSRMMSGIRSKNTKPEITIRRLLHRLGFRFRLHRKDLAGKPDIVLPKWGAVVFVNGCYWHGHENCHLYRPPKSRTEFWINKIAGNRQRDLSNQTTLLQNGWKVIVVWECAVSKSSKLSAEELEASILTAMSVNEHHIDIRGKSDSGNGYGLL